MMGSVVASPAGRGDLLLRRGADCTVAVRWQQDRQDGNGFAPVDLRRWTGRLVLYGPSGEEAWIGECSGTSQGYMSCDVTASALSGMKWLTGGSWRMYASGGGRTEVLGEGYFELT